MTTTESGALTPVDTRNVVDRYKYWTDEAIREDLAETRHPFRAAMEHWKGDFNISTLVRNANAFNAAEVLYVGKRQWDKRGAVGTYLYTKVNHMQTLADLKEACGNSPIIGVDNLPGAQSLIGYDWPEDAVMLFGEEATGLTPEALAMCSATVYIPQMGSVRSLNAGVASGIAMYSWAQQHAKTLSVKDF